MNKKGQVPTIILFIMAIVLGITALYTMIKFDGVFDSNSKNLTDFMLEAGFNEDYVKAQAKSILNESLIECGECSAEVLKEKIKENAAESESINRYSGAGNFYGKIRNSEFDIAENPEGKEIRFENLFVQGARGYNKIERNFDLCLKIKLNNEISKCN